MLLSHFFAHMTNSNLANWQIAKFQYYVIMLSQSLYVHKRETHWQFFFTKMSTDKQKIKVIFNVEQFLRHK